MAGLVTAAQGDHGTALGEPVVRFSSSVLASGLSGAQALVETTVDAKARPRLTLLRSLERASRLTRARDPNRTCCLAAAYGARCPKGCALTFFRLLGSTLRERPRYYSPAAAAVTRHEAWLLRLLERIEADDAASVKALVAFQISPAHRRSMRAAAIEFSENIAALELEALAIS